MQFDFGHEEAPPPPRHGAPTRAAELLSTAQAEPEAAKKGSTHTMHSGSTVLTLKELPPSVQAVLSDFDVDGDGVIDVSELQAAHHALQSARRKVRPQYRHRFGPRREVQCSPGAFHVTVLCEEENRLAASQPRSYVQSYFLGMVVPTVPKLRKLWLRTLHPALRAALIGSSRCPTCARCPLAVPAPLEATCSTPSGPTA